MEEIARRAKVGVGTVYRHFPTKDDLVEALAGERFVRLAELADEALEHDDHGRRSASSCARRREIQVADRALSEVLVSRPGDDARAPPRASGCSIWSTKLIRRAQDAGALRADAEPEDVPMMMCALAGACNHPMSDPERYIGDRHRRDARAGRDAAAAALTALGDSALADRDQVPLLEVGDQLLRRLLRGLLPRCRQTISACSGAS